MQRGAHEASDCRHVCRAASHQAIKYKGLLNPATVYQSKLFGVSIVSNMFPHCANANGGRRYANSAGVPVLGNATNEVMHA